MRIRQEKSHHRKVNVIFTSRPGLPPPVIAGMPVHKAISATIPALTGDEGRQPASMRHR
jgi:hypothetical protein